jgi:hypothetical protein
MKKTTLTLLLIGLGWMPTWAQDVRSQLRQIAADLAKQIEAKGKKRVVIASFLDLKNQETELGRYMADKFSIGMSTASATLEITDRSQLSQLLRDNKLAADRILDPKTIPNLGKITGAEVIITANYTALDNSVDITVKAIDLERGLRLAVAEGQIPRTSEINKLLSEVSSSDSDITSVPSGAKPSIDAKLPKPATDCATKNNCVICAKNISSSQVEVKRNYNIGNNDQDRRDLLIYTGETKCWQNVWIGNNEDYFKCRVLFFQNGSRVKEEFVNVRACEVKLVTFNK